MNTQTERSRDDLIVPSISPAELDRLSALLAEADGRAAWWVELAQRIDALGDGLALHRAQAEGAHGLHAQVIADEPRLTAAVGRLGADHNELEEELRRARAMVGEAAGDPEGAEAAIAQVRSLIARMRRHQETAYRVVSDAYNVDIGGG